MRALIFITTLGLAGPAVGQSVGQDIGQLNALDQLRFSEIQAQQQLLQQQQVARHNELMAMEARLRTEQHAARIQAERQPVRLPELPYPAAAISGAIDASSLPSIPDAALAASNRRVREIVKNRN